MFETNRAQIIEAINEKMSGRLEELVNHYQDATRGVIHNLLEKYVREQFDTFMEKRVGELIIRADGKQIQDYRNGSRTIGRLVIDTIPLEQFSVPRNRAGGFSPRILRRTGKRIAGVFASLAKELYVNGVSTRRVRRSFEQACLKISGLSKSSVNRINKELMEEYLRWANRRITGKFTYLQADGVGLKVRKYGKSKAGMLIITGITAEGRKEVLHFTLGTESRDNFDEILHDLARRGMDTQAVKLFTVDGAKGPIGSIMSVFGQERLQRCTVHKTRNVLEKTPRALRDELKAKLGRLFNQPSRVDAEKFLEGLVTEYQMIAPQAMECLLEDIDDVLRFYEFPDAHRKSIRSTNIIERVINEVRRRTKVMHDCVDTIHGCYGIVMGVVREQNERWGNRSHWVNRSK